MTPRTGQQPPLIELKVNHRLEVQLTAGPYQGIYPTRVEEVHPDRFHVAELMAGGQILPLASGQRVRCQLAAPSGFYEFDSVVLGREGGRVPVTVLSMPRSYERVQRRNFVRLDVQVPVRYAVMPPGTSGRPLVPPPGPIIATRTADLSGGGVALYTPQPLLDGAILDMWIALPEGEEIHATGQVMRVGDRGPDGSQIAGVRFIGLTERDRNAVIRFIFREQRERRRRGLT